MKEQILSWIAEHQTLNIQSPYQEIKKFNPETKTTSVQAVSFYEFCLEQEYLKAETLRKAALEIGDKDTVRETNSLFEGTWSTSTYAYDLFSPEGRARDKAEQMVKEKKRGLWNAIMTSTESFLRAEIARGKVPVNIQREIKNLRSNGVEYCENILFLCGVTSLKQTGSYVPLIENKEPIAIQKKTNVEEEPEEEEDDDPSL